MPIEKSFLHVLTFKNAILLFDKARVNSMLLQIRAILFLSRYVNINNVFICEIQIKAVFNLH
jgi:hypothetical protein